MEETLTYTAQLALQKHSAEAIRKKVRPGCLLLTHSCRDSKKKRKKKKGYDSILVSRENIWTTITDV